MKKNIKKNNQGVSLIELVVAITLFSVLILSSTQIFQMVVDGQRSAVSAQNLQENMRYALEKMSKEIRTAVVSNQDCLGSAEYKVFNKITDADGNDRLYFKNKNGQCVIYYLDEARLNITVDGQAPVFITPAKIEVNSLKFYVVDDLIGAAHGVQPYATMMTDIKAKGPAAHEQPMKIQTTISLRYYE